MGTLSQILDFLQYQHNNGGAAELNMAARLAESKTSYELDDNLRKELADMVEELTTTGNTSLDPETMKKLKRICKKSDGYIDYAYSQLMDQLNKEHAEIRLSTFQVIDELFQRSHKFRQLVVAEMQEFLLLTVETDVDFPLPPPKAAARLLKEQTLRAVADWNGKYGKAYKKLAVGYNFLKHCKKIDFNNVTARLEAERTRERVRAEREERLKHERFTQAVKEMTEVLPEIDKCLRETESCYDILFPKNSLNFECDMVSNEDISGDMKNRKVALEESECQNKPDPAPSSSKSSGIEAGNSSRTSGQTAETANLTVGGKSPTRGVKNQGSLGGEVFTAINLQEGVLDPRTVGHVTGLGDVCNSQSDDLEGEATDSKLMDEILGQENLCNRKAEEKKPEESGVDGASPESGDEDEDEAHGQSGNTNGMQSHGVRSLVQNINIDIEIPTEGVDLVENENNTDLIGALDDAKKLLEAKYARHVNRWIEDFRNANKTQTDFFKKCLDMRSALSEALAKYSDLKIRRLPRVRQVACAADDSDDEFEEVPEKEGYEPVIAEDKRGEYGLPPVKKESPSKAPPSSEAGTSRETPSPGASTELPSSRHHTDWHPLLSCEHDPKDPTSRAATLASLGIEEEPVQGMKRKLDEQPTNAGKTAEGSSKQAKKTEDADLLSRAPVVPFGVDLENWETPDQIKAPVILRTQTDNRVWISSSNEEEVVIEKAKEDITKRVFSFTGKFVPVKWKCRAQLPSGKLCERMDRVKCPFHGKVIPRNEDGTPSEPEDLPLPVKQEEVEEEVVEHSSPDTATSSRHNAELLRDLGDVTGVNPTVGTQRGRGKGTSRDSSKKGKGKKKGVNKYPGLTDLTQRTNTSRNRLEKRVFNKSAMKRVNEKLTAMDDRRIRDKFSNQFHYALH